MGCSKCGADYSESMMVMADGMQYLTCGECGNIDAVPFKNVQ